MRDRDRTPADGRRRGHPQGGVPVRPVDDRRGRPGATPAPSLTRRSRVPWVLLSGGVDDATFERQVRRRLRGRGLRGPGRALGLGAVGRAATPRARCLARRQRTGRGSAGWPSWSTRSGAPWRPRWAAARRPEAPEPGWYERYCGREPRPASRSTCSSSARSTPTSSSSATRTRARSSARPERLVEGDPADRSAARRRSRPAAPPGSGSRVSVRRRRRRRRARAVHARRRSRERGVDVSACRVDAGPADRRHA